MLLLGVVQAQVTGAPAVAGSYDLLQTEILTGSQASVTFSSLGDYAADYQHLQLRYAARTNRGFENSGLFVRFNGDSGNNYALHYLQGFGGGVSSAASTSRSTTLGLPIVGGTAGAGQFGAGVVDILDPFSSSKYTTVRGLGGCTGTFTSLQLASGLWMNTASITSINLVAILSDSYVSGSRFSLYGLKKASV